MNVGDIYRALEDRYYSLIDWLVEHGIPADRLVDAIESKGIPSLPVVAVGLLLILAGAGYGLYTVFGPKTYVITLYGPDGQPLANTTVYVNGHPYVTDAQGQLRLEGVSGIVEISAPGMSPKFVDPSQVSSISMSAETKHVVINISDAKTGKPVSATVTVLGENGTKTLSGYRVEFDISEYPSPNTVQVDNSGSVTATISADGYQNASVTINWDEGNEDTIEKNVQLLSLTAVGGTTDGSQVSTTKTGSVVFDITPSGVDGYLKIFYRGILYKGPIYFNTDQGPVKVNLPYGTYTVLFVPNVKGEDFVTYANRITVTVDQPEKTVKFTLTLPAPAPNEMNAETLKNITTEINVLDARTGKPIVGAELVDANTGEVLGKSDAHGVIRLAIGSDVTAYVKAPGYYKSTTITVGPNKEGYVVKMQPLPGKGNIELTVVAPQDIPAAGAVYTVLDANGNVLTSGSCDQEGRALIKDLPADENLTVTAEIPGTPLKGHTQVTLEKDQTLKLKLLVAATETVQLIVEDAEKGEQISARYEIAAGSQILGTGLVSPFAPVSLELPVDVPLTVVLNYGPGGKYTYRTTVTLKGDETQLVIKVPTPGKSAVYIEGIYNAAGQRMAAILPGTPYTVKVLASCGDSKCSWAVKAQGIKVDQDSITVSCHSGSCAQEITLVAKADKTGVAILEIGNSKLAVAVGAPITVDEILQQGAVARVMVYDPETNAEASKYNLEPLKTYRFVVVAAAKYSGSSVPGAVLQTGAIKITKPTPVSTAADGNIFVFADQFEGMYPNPVKQPTEQYISVSIPALGMTPSDSVWFIPQGTSKLKASVTPDTIIKGCSGYQVVEYSLTDQDGKEPAAQHYMATVNGETVELSGPKGTLKIPTVEGDSVTIQFAATGYGTAEVTLKTKEIDAQANGSFTYNTEEGKTEGTLEVTLSDPNAQGEVPSQKISADGWILQAEGDAFTGSGKATLSLVQAPDSPESGTIYGTVDVNVNGGAGWCSITASAPIDVTVVQGKLQIVNAKCEVTPSNTNEREYTITVSFTPAINNEPIQDAEATVEGEPVLINNGNYTYAGTVECKDEETQTLQYTISVDYEGETAQETVECKIPPCTFKEETCEQIFDQDCGYIGAVQSIYVTGCSKYYDFALGAPVEKDSKVWKDVYYHKKGAKCYTELVKLWAPINTTYNNQTDTWEFGSRTEGKWNSTYYGTATSQASYKIRFYLPTKEEHYFVAGNKDARFIAFPGAILNIQSATYFEDTKGLTITGTFEQLEDQKPAEKEDTITLSCKKNDNELKCTGGSYTAVLAKNGDGTYTLQYVDFNSTYGFNERYYADIKIVPENCIDAAKRGDLAVSYSDNKATVTSSGCSAISTTIEEKDIDNGCQQVTLKDEGSSEVSTCVGEVNTSLLLAPYRFPKVIGPNEECEYLCSGYLSERFSNAYYRVKNGELEIHVGTLGDKSDAQLCTATWCGPVLSLEQVLGYINACGSGCEDKEQTYAYVVPANPLDISNVGSIGIDIKLLKPSTATIGGKLFAEIANVGGRTLLVPAEFAPFFAPIDTEYRLPPGKIVYSVWKVVNSDGKWEFQNVADESTTDKITTLVNVSSEAFETKCESLTNKANETECYANTADEKTVEASEFSNHKGAYVIQIIKYYPAVDLEALVGTPDTGYKDYYALIMALGNKIDKIDDIPDEYQNILKKYPADYTWWSDSEKIYGYKLAPSISNSNSTIGATSTETQTSGKQYYRWGVGGISPQNEQQVCNCDKSCKCDTACGTSCQSLPTWKYFSGNAQPGTGADWYIYLYGPSMLQNYKGVHVALLPQTVRSIMEHIDTGKVVTHVLAAVPVTPNMFKDKKPITLTENKAVEKNIIEPLLKQSIDWSDITCSKPSGEEGQLAVKVCKSELPISIGAWMVMPPEGTGSTSTGMTKIEAKSYAEDLAKAIIKDQTATLEEMIHDKLPQNDKEKVEIEKIIPTEYKLNTRVFSLYSEIEVTQNTRPQGKITVTVNASKAIPFPEKISISNGPKAGDVEVLALQTKDNHKICILVPSDYADCFTDECKKDIKIEGVWAAVAQEYCTRHGTKVSCFEYEKGWPTTTSTPNPIDNIDPGAAAKTCIGNGCDVCLVPEIKEIEQDTSQTSASGKSVCWKVGNTTVVCST